MPEQLIGGVDALAAALRAVADHPLAEDPDAHVDVAGVDGAPADGAPADGARADGARADGARSGGAHEVADELAGTDPDGWSAGAARLATQVHLLAVDVAALTSARHPAGAVG